MYAPNHRLRRHANPRLVEQDGHLRIGEQLGLDLRLEEPLVARAHAEPRPAHAKPRALRDVAPEEERRVLAGVRCGLHLDERERPIEKPDDRATTAAASPRHRRGAAASAPRASAHRRGAAPRRACRQPACRRPACLREVARPHRACRPGACPLRACRRGACPQGERPTAAACRPVPAARARRPRGATGGGEMRRASWSCGGSFSFAPAEAGEHESGPGQNADIPSRAGCRGVRRARAGGGQRRNPPPGPGALGRAADTGPGAGPVARAAAASAAGTGAGGGGRGGPGIAAARAAACASGPAARRGVGVGGDVPGVTRVGEAMAVVRGGIRPINHSPRGPPSPGR